MSRRHASVLHRALGALDGRQPGITSRGALGVVVVSACALMTAGPRADARAAVHPPLPTAQSDAARAGQAASTRRIARKQRGGLLVVLTATRTSSAAPAPRATVRIRALRRRHGAWREIGRRIVGRRNGFFWYPLTGRHAVQGFRVNPHTGAIRFRLLLTPALGYSRPYRFNAAGDHLTPACSRGRAA